MEVEDGRALVAAFRAMEPSSDVVSLARKLGGGVLSMDAQTFFLEKCLNDEWMRRPARVIHQLGCT
jgi:hypothetical protein